MPARSRRERGARSRADGLEALGHSVLLQAPEVVHVGDFAYSSRLLAQWQARERTG
jgi:hypothetical protein